MGGKTKEEPSFDIIVFNPVGTSIGERCALSREDTVERWRNTIGARLDGADLGERLDHSAGGIEPAEVSSLFAFAEEKQAALENKSILVVLVHSGGVGEVCAEAVKRILEAYSTNKVFEAGTWTIKLEELVDLVPDDVDKFRAAMGELADTIDRYCGDNPGAELFMNITGGYKSLAPYLVILGSAIKEMSIFYLFEEAERLLWLPMYAISFDYAEWFEHRALLLPFENDRWLTKEQRNELRGSLTRTRVESLILDKAPFTLSPVGKLISTRDRALRDTKRFSDYGTGLLLTDSFRNQALGHYLRDRIRYWRYFATGDRIPETVEHGRGHVQRLLEFTRQVLTAIRSTGSALNDNQLLVLVAAIWLHDIGHSGDWLSIDKDLFDAASGDYSLRDDPEQVRAAHHILSAEIIWQERKFLFGPAEAWPLSSQGLDYSAFVQSVRLTALYHRKSMPGPTDTVLPKEFDKKTLPGIKAKYRYTDDGIMSRTIFKEAPDRFCEVVALLRFIDGSDNQNERAGDPAFYEVLQWTINRHVSSLRKSRKALTKAIKSCCATGQPAPQIADALSQIRRQIKFKTAQPGHYKKHRLLQHVFLVRAADTDSVSLHTYGEVNLEKHPFILEGYAVANESAGTAYNDDEVAREILHGWVQEYLLTEAHLPFRFRVFLLKNDGSRKNLASDVSADNAKVDVKWR